LTIRVWRSAAALGVRGIAIVGHGRSNANAIKNAVRVAAD
jgi:fatty acid/phospholipid biosynthesis enzyme